jgi:hypothetical protein
MRFMVIVKANKDSEAGVMPSEEMMTTMGKYNDELVEAGIMQAGEGLLPSSNGARVDFSGDSPVVVRGPFPEAEQLIAGFWILKANSLDEVIEWVKKAPFEEGALEVRQIAGPEDFGDEYTPELRAQEDRQRERIKQQHGDQSL